MPRVAATIVSATGWLVSGRRGRLASRGETLLRYAVDGVEHQARCERWLGRPGTQVWIELEEIGAERCRPVARWSPLVGIGIALLLGLGALAIASACGWV